MKMRERKKGRKRGQMALEGTRRGIVCKDESSGRTFVIRKLACSNCDRSTAVLRGREKRWKKGMCREWENRRGKEH